MIRRLYALILLSGLFIVLSACQQPSPAPASTPDSSFKQLEFGALRQISDYPLYELHYTGSTGLDDVLKKNAPSGSQFSPFACSVFAVPGVDGQALLGRNFDWDLHPALLLFTDPPDALASVSMVDISYLGYSREKTPLQDPAALQRAPFLPFDGMNEAGLAVGMMAVNHAEGGSDPAKTTLEDLDLIRLWLDRAHDVPEAIQLLADYNIRFEEVPLHYLVADASGAAALVEFVDGKPVVQYGRANGLVSTNFIVAEEKPEGANSSCERYNRMVTVLEGSAGKLDAPQGLTLLKEVSQPTTRWSVVYNLAKKEITLVMGRDYGAPLHFTLPPQ